MTDERAAVELLAQLLRLGVQVDERDVHGGQSVAPVLGSGARNAHFVPPNGWLRAQGYPASGTGKRGSCV